MPGVDTLALVSKVLLDTRFLELKRENEDLKLRLFWIDHSINTLKVLMARANQVSHDLRCRCRSCMYARRFQPTIFDADNDEIKDEDCKFKPWFEQVLQEHGLSVGRGGDPHPEDFDREFYPRPNLDVHFHVVESENTWSYNSWAKLMYGAKLWKAQTTQDPELLKLTALFKTLGGMMDRDCSILDTHESDSDS